MTSSALGHAEFENCRIHVRYLFQVLHEVWLPHGSLETGSPRTGSVSPLSHTLQ